MPLSRVGWIKPITEENFHDFAKIPSRSFHETNLRGFVAQEVDYSIYITFRKKHRFQTIKLLNLILGPVCEVLFYQTITEQRVKRDLPFLPSWFLKLVLTILSPVLLTCEEIWRACVFFFKLSSLKAEGRVLK